jgi:hypothetical protein
LADLTQKLSYIGLDLPVAVAGRATVEFKVSVPINAPRTGKAYRLNGSLVVQNLIADKLRFDRVIAEVDLSDGILKLKSLRCVQHIRSDGTDVSEQGTVTGSATAELVPRGRFSADVVLEDFEIGPLAELLSRFEIGARGLQGQVSADVALGGQVEDIGKPDRWTIAGDLNATNLRRENSIPINLLAKEVRFGKDRLEIPQLRLESAQGPGFYLDASVELDFAETNRFHAKLRSNDLPLRELTAFYATNLDALLEGKIDLDGDASGVIGGHSGIESIDVRLAIASPALSVAGVDLGMLEHDLRLTNHGLSITPRGQNQTADRTPLKVDSIRTNYELTEQHFKFTDLSAQIFGGEVQGNGQFARKGDQTHQIDAKWSRIEPNFSFPIAAFPRPLELSVRTSGTVNWNVPAEDVLRPAKHQGQISMKLERIGLGKEEIGEADVEIAVDREKLSATILGELFDGVVKIRAEAPLDGISRWPEIVPRLQMEEATLSDLSLRRFLKTAMVDRPRFDARVSGAFRPEPVGTVPPAGNAFSLTGAFDVGFKGLSADGILISRSLEATIESENSNFVVKSARGSYAGGQLQVRGSWTLGKGIKLLTARLTRGDGQRMLVPIHRDASTWAGGIISGRATIEGRDQAELGLIRITGALDIKNGSTFGVPVGEAHGPFSVSVDTQPWGWKVSFPSVASRLATGRMAGRIALSSSGAGRSGLNVDSKWRLTHVDFEKLLSTYVGSSTLGRGDLTGEVSILGRHVRSAKDLQGQMRLRLGGTDATAVPGLSAAGSLLGATSLVGVRFESGQAIVRIHKGNLILETLSLSSDRVGVQAHGKVGLLDRRLDVDAVIATGNFQGQDALLRTLGQQALVQAIPIARLNALISDRTIVIKVIGPTRDPIIRLMTGETLQANARRFAVEQALGLAVANSLIFD